MGTLSQTQIDSFRDRGFLAVPDLLHSDEVDRIAAAAREEFETHRYIDAKARFPAPTKYILSEDSLRLADIRLVVDHPRIVGAVSELLADEVCLSAFVIYSMPPGTEGTGGDGLLANRAPGRIAETRLLVEHDERFLVVDRTVPGGAAQPSRKRVGTDDDNVIPRLMDAAGPQLGGPPPWVSYLGDYPVGAGGGDRCRVYACPRDLLTGAVEAVPGARWLAADGLSDETGHGYLAAAAESWLHDPVLRGIGQSSQAAAHA